MPNPNNAVMHEVLAKNNLTVEDIKRQFTMYSLDPEVGK
jgi:hypothetical protein